MRLGTVSLWSDDVDKFRRQVRLADELGYGLICVGDSPTAWQDVYVSMAVAAAEINRAVLATMVTAPYLRHPMILARSMLSLAQINEGRVAIGLGFGGSATASIGRPAVGLEYMRDFVNALHGLFNGESVKWDGLTCAPFKGAHPVPIYMAAEGPKALHLSGEVGDGVVVNVGFNLDIVDRRIEAVRAGAADAGRDPKQLEIWGNGYVSVRPTREEAIHDIVAHLAGPGGLGMRRPYMRALVPAELDDKIQQLIDAYTTTQHVTVGSGQAQLVEKLGLADFLASLTSIVGTPEEVRNLVKGLESRGVSTLIAPLPGNADPDGTLHRLHDALR